jgi:hypothetical protein
MSGYLQRLVSSAMDSRQPPAIRPVLGATYAPSSAEPVEISEAAEIRPGEKAEGREHREDGVATPREVADAPEVRREMEEPRTKRIEPEFKPREVFQPLVAQSVMEMERPKVDPVAPTGEGDDAPRREEETAAPIAQDSAEAEGPQVKTVTRRVISYRPLVPSMVGDPAAALPGAVKRTAKQSLVRSEERAASTPDDIQIHIGRVEVTAVQQTQAPRAPVRPARRSVNLEEYLKRGDRRSR